MRIAKAVEMALNILLHSRLRSWLTIIGIVIGVGAVVAIISMGEGLQLNVSNRLSGFGANIITISAGGGRAFGGFREGGGGGPTATASSQNITLTTKDTQALKLVQGIQYIEGTISGRVDVYYLGQKSTNQVQGVDPQVAKAVMNPTLSSGRFIGPGDSNVVVIGYNVANKEFKQPLGLNQMIQVGGKEFRIIGILAQSTSLGFGGSDSSFIMPIDAARTILTDIGSNEFGSITVVVSDPNSIDQATADIQTTLMASRHVANKTIDFSVSSAKQVQQQVSSITSTLTLFLSAIAAVSLVVGAIGVANTMFTAVLEKTKDIGIMKAIGAKNRDVLMIFLINSGLVGFVGGMLGIALGVLASSMINTVGLRLGFITPGGGEVVTVVSPQLMIVSLVFSVAIGMAAGAVPAYRASQLKPVDALRFE